MGKYSYGGLVQVLLALSAALTAVDVEVLGKTCDATDGHSVAMFIHDWYTDCYERSARAQQKNGAVIQGRATAVGQKAVELLNANKTEEAMELQHNLASEIRTINEIPQTKLFLCLVRKWNKDCPNQPALNFFQIFVQFMCEGRSGTNYGQLMQFSPYVITAPCEAMKKMSDKEANITMDALRCIRQNVTRFSELVSACREKPGALPGGMAGQFTMAEDLLSAMKNSTCSERRTKDCLGLRAMAACDVKVACSYSGVAWKNLECQGEAPSCMMTLESLKPAAQRKQPGDKESEDPARSGGDKANGVASVTKGHAHAHHLIALFAGVAIFI